MFIYTFRYLLGVSRCQTLVTRMTHIISLFKRGMLRGCFRALLLIPQLMEGSSLLLHLFIVKNFWPSSSMPTQPPVVSLHYGFCSINMVIPKLLVWVNSKTMAFDEV